MSPSNGPREEMLRCLPLWSKRRRRALHQPGGPIPSARAGLPLARCTEPGRFGWPINRPRESPRGSGPCSAGEDLADDRACASNQNGEPVGRPGLVEPARFLGPCDTASHERRRHIEGVSRPLRFRLRGIHGPIGQGRKGCGRGSEIRKVGVGLDGPHPRYRHRLGRWSSVRGRCRHPSHRERDSRRGRGGRGRRILDSPASTVDFKPPPEAAAGTRSPVVTWRKWPRRGRRSPWSKRPRSPSHPAGTPCGMRPGRSRRGSRPLRKARPRPRKTSSATCSVWPTGCRRRASARGVPRGGRHSHIVPTVRGIERDLWIRWMSRGEGNAGALAKDDDLGKRMRDLGVVGSSREAGKASVCIRSRC